MQKAELKSYTQEVLKDNPSLKMLGSVEDYICYVARVSNPKSQLNSLNNSKLIEYLLNHKHWSPFEMVDVTLEITTTRDVSRQLLRHRSFSFQEYSQRYSEAPNSTPLKECRLQDHKNRQNSIETEDEELEDWWFIMQHEVTGFTRGVYEEALDKGIAKEVARVLLPEGLTETKMYMKGSLRSWMHFIELRTGPETQKETRELASMCAMEVAKVFPMITEFVSHA